MTWQMSLKTLNLVVYLCNCINMHVINTTLTVLKITLCDSVGVALSSSMLRRFLIILYQLCIVIYSIIFRTQKREITAYLFQITAGRDAEMWDAGKILRYQVNIKSEPGVVTRVCALWSNPDHYPCCWWRWALHT